MSKPGSRPRIRKWRCSNQAPTVVIASPDSRRRPASKRSPPGACWGRHERDAEHHHGHGVRLRDQAPEAGRDRGGAEPAGTVRTTPREQLLKALMKSEAAPGLILTDVAEPAVGINDVLVRVTTAGICGTDLHIRAWDDWARGAVTTPLVVGHEFVGEVVDVGDNVKGFAPGDRVSGEGHLVCGRCRNCMAGRRHLCAATESVGVNRAGAFAEYIALPMTNLWRHEDEVPDDVAAIFDPLGNAVHAALSFRVLGEDVLITGAGPIGQMAAAVARHAGARHIVITDVNPHRLEQSLALGVTRTVDVTREDLADVQRELGMSEGFDVALEMSGQPSALRQILGNMSHGGKIALLGIPTEDISIDWTTVVFNMLTLRGIFGREMYETWYAMTVMLQSGLDISPVITHRFAAADFDEAFDTAADGRAGKVLLDWTD
jgi:threonine 3-dehydrogenase